MPEPEPPVFSPVGGEVADLAVLKSIHPGQERKGQIVQSSEPFPLPVFLLTDPGEMDVSILSLGHFRGGEAWLTIPVGDDRQVLMFSSKSAAQAFIDAMPASSGLQKLLVVECDLDEIIEVMSPMETSGIATVVLDYSSPRQRTAPIGTVLNHLKSLRQR
jgi:hypothetical protein